MDSQVSLTQPSALEHMLPVIILESGMKEVALSETSQLLNFEFGKWPPKFEGEFSDAMLTQEFIDEDRS